MDQEILTAVPGIDRVAVSGYHMPFPLLGYVERVNGGGYRCLAHTYQLNL